MCEHIAITKDVQCIPLKLCCQHVAPLNIRLVTLRDVWHAHRRERADHVAFPGESQYKSNVAFQHFSVLNRWSILAQNFQVQGSECRKRGFGHLHLLKISGGHAPGPPQQHRERRLHIQSPAECLPFNIQSQTQSSHNSAYSHSGGSMIHIRTDNQVMWMKMSSP